MEDPGILILDEPMTDWTIMGVEIIRDWSLRKRKNDTDCKSLQEDIHLLCDDVYEFEGGHMRKVTNISLK